MCRKVKSRHVLAFLCALAGIFSISVPGTAADKESVWLAPDAESPDFMQMFSRPDSWPKARSQINVLKLLPRHFNPDATGINTFNQLKEVGAFKKLASWGINVAVEEGAVKEWDCTAQKAAQITIQHMKNAELADTTIGLIAMDEPIVSGAISCKLSLGEIAARTAAYAHSVKTAPERGDGRTVPLVGDIEPYPSQGAEAIFRWTKLLEKLGFKPSFFHLDINVHYVDVHPEVDMAGDLKKLSDFFHQESIPFGIIFWSGYDPLSDDRDYYNHTMTLVRSVKAAIGIPDQTIFQSWVIRSPESCWSRNEPCLPQDCKVSDGPNCGKRSIPFNIPENAPNLFTHTRLVNDALRELRGR